MMTIYIYAYICGQNKMCALKKPQILNIRANAGV